MQSGAEVSIAITPALPWWFGIVIIGATFLVVIGVVQLVGDVIAQARIKDRRELQHRYRGRQTFFALGLGVVVALLVGLNIQTIWYSVQPELQPPTENIADVRGSFEEQGIAEITLRDTDPPNSLVLIDEEAWHAGQPLELLLSCDAGQHPSAGHYPAYEGFDWDLPVQYVTDGTTVDAVLERTVTHDSCNFEMVAD